VISFDRQTGIQISRGCCAPCDIGINAHAASASLPLHTTDSALRILFSFSKYLYRGIIAAIYHHADLFHQLTLGLD
jgi:hypothetical protein